VNDLVTWLRAQLDEDERMALEADALAPSPWRVEDQPYPNVLDISGGTVVETESGFNPPEISVQTHIARHDPVHVRAEVEAKRRILDLLHHEGGDYLFADIFKLLALPYADQPGYRDEWRP